MLQNIIGGLAANKSPQTSPWSATWNFLTVLATPQLAVPVNDDIGLQISNASLSWSQVQSADTYIVQLSTHSNFSDFVLNDSTYNSNKFDYSNLKNNIKYYWRVQARNAIGDTSNWSDTNNFSTMPATPVLIYPGNNTAGVPSSGSFAWNAVTGASSYKIQVSRDSNFVTTDINIPNLNALYYPYNSLENNTKYYWQVNATGLTGTSNWSGKNVFKTNLPPPTFNLPSNNSTEILQA